MNSLPVELQKHILGFMPAHGVTCWQLQRTRKAAYPLDECAICCKPPIGFFAWFGHSESIVTRPAGIVCRPCYLTQGVVYEQQSDGIFHRSYTPLSARNPWVRIRHAGFLPPYGMQEVMWTRVAYHDDGTWYLEIL